MRSQNPNNSNQYQSDPRQKLCWDFYIDPTSPTFSNAKQSAIKAGYDDSYAEHIKQSAWFCGKLRRFTMRNTAELALDEILSIPIRIETSDTWSPATALTDIALIKIKQDVAKFVVERLCPEDWSLRKEIGTRARAGSPIVDPAKKAMADKLLDEHFQQKHCECCSNRQSFVVERG